MFEPRYKLDFPLRPKKFDNVVKNGLCLPLLGKKAFPIKFWGNTFDIVHPGAETIASDESGSCGKYESPQPVSASAKEMWDTCSDTFHSKSSRQNLQLRPMAS